MLAMRAALTMKLRQGVAHRTAAEVLCVLPTTGLLLYHTLNISVML
jgi:hypothetical protein